MTPRGRWRCGADPKGQDRAAVADRDGVLVDEGTGDASCPARDAQPGDGVGGREVDQDARGAASGQCHALGVPAAHLQGEGPRTAGQCQAVASEAHDRAGGPSTRQLEAHPDVGGRVEAMRLGIGCAGHGEDGDDGQEGGRLQRANGEHSPHIDGDRTRVEQRLRYPFDLAKCAARRAVAVPVRRRLPPGTRPREWCRTFVDTVAGRARPAGTVQPARDGAQRAEREMNLNPDITSAPRASWRE